MHHHSVGLVVLSVMAAVIGGYAALDFAQRSARASDPRVSRRWLLLAATTMGLGIWSMHFIGMIALDLGFPVQYQPSLVALSMLVAVLGAGVALYVVTRGQAGRSSVFLGAGFMGSAVAAMHYIGMASMQMPASIEWNIPLVVLSILIAYGASLLALGLIFSLTAGQRWRAGPRAVAGLAIGIGVAGLHYTAMAAATFHMDMEAIVAPSGVSTSSIAILLGIAAGLMFVVLLFGANLDAQRGARAQDLAVVAGMMRDVARSDSARQSICVAACELTDARYVALLEPGIDGGLVRTDSHGDASVTHDVAQAQAVFEAGRRHFRPGERGEDSSTLYEPIGFDERRIGVLFVVWPHSVRHLSDHAVTVAGLLATEASFAIDRADMLEQLERQASTDELTGLPNRRTVQAELDRQLAQASRGHQPLAVAMLDFDHFKSYNDSHGHQGGDRLLKDVAASWMEQLRGGDMAGRYGGEEFLVVLPQCELDAAVATADRLRKALPAGETCSAGVALWDGEESAEALVARADAALYSAKSRGRDRTEEAVAIPRSGAAQDAVEADRHDDATEWFATEDSLRSVLDVGVDALVLIDAAGRILEWNRAAEGTFGWTRAKALGADLSELLKSDELRLAHQATAEDEASGPSLADSGEPLELTAHHRDGREVPVEMRLSVVDVGGRPHIVAFLRDITDLTATETELRRFESIVASSEDAILSGSAGGVIETWNPAAERLYGYTAKEMIGTNIARLRPADDPAGASEERRKAVRSGGAVSLESRERRRDGTLVDVAATIAPLRDASGETIGFTAVARDVTERKAAAARLLEAHSQFEGAFGAATIGMALVAPDGRFLAVNPALCALLKRDNDTLLASTFQELTHPDDLEDDIHLLEEALEGKRDSYRMSKRYLLPDGGIVWGLLTVTLVRDVDGTPLHFVSQIQDIADRKTAEGEMRRYARHLEVLSNQDPLTGLANRRAFSAALAEELNVQAAGGSACSVLLVAVDGDDTAVMAIAELVTRSGRDENLVAHLGAGELAILLPGVDGATAASILERTRNQLEDPPGVHFAHATAKPGDEPAAVLNRARDNWVTAANRPHPKRTHRATCAACSRWRAASSECPSPF